MRNANISRTENKILSTLHWHIKQSTPNNTMSRSELYQGYKNYEVAFDKINTEMLHRATGNQAQEYPEQTFADLAKMKKQVVEDIIKLRREVQATYGDGDYGHEKNLQTWEDILKGC
ncbi:hypothetical protein AOL_s00076g627 [Orbilia oligospora ATCC 24927]|uniref:Uncharacterized protein n=2 Tax=Orbilia oligospora TaxID=2813651 RepID=G1XAG9_ARTOA|nr:hypothetical protein AOL_s00076g627 [Orbilia oligospora ATCC 24927]EGX49829.1 hypothetical protein AOL_s00076g627 [Orbilia oligospora ATCC 24927]KAF3273756.1 hypothetical protein TWF970_008355 [Orbilia oligospora]